MDTKVPISTADNAYDLLSEIIQLILGEPKRYDQTDWLYTGDSAKDNYQEWTPACQTVGCVAGWTVLLKIGDVYNTFKHAMEILGITNDQADVLFSGAAAGFRYERDDKDDTFITEASLRTHAERGAAHIR